MKAKNVKNLGKFKPTIRASKNQTIDARSYENLSEHLLNLAKTLYTGLSYGVRIPAIYSSNIYYDSTKGWDYVNTQPDSTFLVGVSVGTDTTKTFLDVTINSALTSKTNVLPLFQVYNTSNTNIPYFINIYDYAASDSTRLKISIDYVDITGDFSNYDLSTGTDEISLRLLGLFKSDAENNDTTFYTYGLPYFVCDASDLQSTYIKLSGYTYNKDLVTDATYLWSTRIRLYAEPWSGDCTTGSGTGTYYYSDWETVYTSGLHIVKISGLSPLTLYKVYVQIDAEKGFDSLDGVAVGCFRTAEGSSYSDPWSEI